MKYLLLLKQKGYGCDYTIGCARNWEVVEAESIDGALDIFMKENAGGYRDETELEYLEIIEVTNAIHIDNPKFPEEEDEYVEELSLALVDSLNEKQINLLLDLVTGETYEKVKKYVPDDILERRSREALESLVNMDWKTG